MDTASQFEGETLADRYQLIERIGRGSAGHVFRARDLETQQEVAVKLSRHKTTPRHEKGTSRFRNEVRILRRLQHPNIVGLLGFGRTPDGYAYMVMELVDGVGLRDLLQGAPVGTEVALRIARQICRALAEVHRKGVVHRDLKPENVLLHRVDRVAFVVRVLDFGLSRVYERAVADRPETCARFGGEPLTRPRTRIGTPAYMAPEQAARGRADARSDLYSLGVILYEMLTGRLPFNSGTKEEIYIEHIYSIPELPSEVRPDVGISPGMDSLVLRLLAKSPDDRPPNAGATLSALNALLAPVPRALSLAPGLA